LQDATAKENITPLVGKQSAAETMANPPDTIPQKDVLSNAIDIVCRKPESPEEVLMDVSVLIYSIQ